MPERTVATSAGHFNPYLNLVRILSEILWITHRTDKIPLKLEIGIGLCLGGSLAGHTSWVLTIDYKNTEEREIPLALLYSVVY